MTLVFVKSLYKWHSNIYLCLHNTAYVQFDYHTVVSLTSYTYFPLFQLLSKYARRETNIKYKGAYSKLMSASVYQQSSPVKC